MSYHNHVSRIAEATNDFRRVLATGSKSQLVVMSILPGEEVGEETHPHTEQTLFFQSGVGEALVGEERFAVGAGDIVIVSPGTRHNFTNTGTEPLKIITVYAPAHHIDGRVHHTKADADADEADEAFGESMEAKEA